MTRIPTARICLIALITITSSACATSGAGYTPSPDQAGEPASPALYGGSYEGVTFTDHEAEASLDYVNTASLLELDERAGIDLRAARSIVKARPIADLETLSGLYFVGSVTLTRLKAAAMAAWQLKGALEPHV